MAITVNTKYDISNTYISELAQYQTLFLLGATRTTTGSGSFTSTSSGVVYSYTAGQQELFEDLRIVLDSFQIDQGDWNNLQNDVNAELVRVDGELSTQLASITDLETIERKYLLNSGTTGSASSNLAIDVTGLSTTYSCFEFVMTSSPSGATSTVSFGLRINNASGADYELSRIKGDTNESGLTLFRIGEPNFYYNNSSKFSTLVRVYTPSHPRCDGSYYHIEAIDTHNYSTTYTVTTYNIGRYNLYPTLTSLNFVTTANQIASGAVWKLYGIKEAV